MISLGAPKLSQCRHSSWRSILSASLRSVGRATGGSLHNRRVWFSVHPLSGTLGFRWASSADFFQCTIAGRAFPAGATVQVRVVTAELLQRVSHGEKLIYPGSLVRKSDVREITKS